MGQHEAVLCRLRERQPALDLVHVAAKPQVSDQGQVRATNLVERHCTGNAVKPKQRSLRRRDRKEPDGKGTRVPNFF